LWFEYEFHQHIPLQFVCQLQHQFASLSRGRTEPLYRNMESGGSDQWKIPHILLGSHVFEADSRAFNNHGIVSPSKAVLVVQKTVLRRETPSQERAFTRVAEAGMRWSTDGYQRTPTGRPIGIWSRTIGKYVPQYPRREAEATVQAVGRRLLNATHSRCDWTRDIGGT